MHSDCVQDLEVEPGRHFGSAREWQGQNGGQSGSGWLKAMGIQQGAQQGFGVIG